MTRVTNEYLLADRIDELPSALAVWHDGPDALPQLLATVVLERLREFERLPKPTVAGHSASDLRMLADHRDRWRHAVSAIIGWHALYGNANRTGVVNPAVPPNRTKRELRRARRRVPRSESVTQRDYTDAVRLAYDWWELDPIRVGLRSGDMTIAGGGKRRLHLRNHRRADVEVLDIALAQVTAIPPPGPGPGSELGSMVLPAPGFGTIRVDPLTRWLQDRAAEAGVGARHPFGYQIINSIPRYLRNSAWDRIETDLVAQSTTVPEDTDLGGITLDAARTCYAFLISQLYTNSAAGALLNTPEMMLWAIRPKHLLSALSARVSPVEAQAFIDMTTFELGRTAVSAPLIPHQEHFLVPYELVSPVAFERTLLRAASADSSRAGNLGNVLGDRGRRWHERLARIPGCHVAAEVRVRDSAGRSAGDLDIVAWDPRADEMLVVETKWPVDAATLAESYKVDATFDKGRNQVQRVRAGIADASLSVNWPPAWDGPRPTTTIHWWVASAQQLDSRVQPDDGILTTSLRLVEQLLPAASLRDLVMAVRALPIPQRGLEYELVPTTVAAGELRLTYPVIHIVGNFPQPPVDRRTHLGWT